MSITLGDAILYLKGDSTQLNKDLGTAESKSKGWAGALGGVLTGAAGTALGFFGAQVIGRITSGIGSFFSSAISGAMESQDVLRQLDAVLKSTGQAATEQAEAYADAQGKVVTSQRLSSEALTELQDELTHSTARLNDMQAAWDKAKTHTESGALALEDAKAKVADLQAQILEGSQTVSQKLTDALGLVAPTAQISRDALIELASALQEVTRFDDEAVISAESLMLTFTGVGKDIFPQAIETVLDMSTALGQDLQSSVIQVGKALQDPILGITALRKVGVNFNAESKETIETLVKQGKVLEAQKFILKELQVEFGGSAKAAGETFGGQLDILKNKLGDMAEELVKGFLPMATEGIQKIVPGITDLAQRIFAFAGSDAVKNGLRNSLSQVYNVLVLVGSWIQTVGLPAFMQLQGWIQIALLPALMLLGAWIGAELVPVFQQVFDILLQGAQVAIPQLVAFWTGVLLPALQQFGAWAQANLLPLLAQFWAWFKINLPIAIQTLVDFFNTVLMPAIQAVWVWVIANLFPLLGTLWAWLKVNIPLAIQTLTNFWNTVLLPAIQAVWAWITGTLMPMLADLWNWLQVNVPAALQTLTNYWQTVLLPAIQAVWAWMSGTLFPFLQSLSDFLGAVFGVAITALAGLWEKVLQPALEKVWGFLDTKVFPIFKAIGDYLDKTLTPVFKAIGDYIRDTLSPILKDIAGGALNGLKLALEGISGAIQDATRWLSDMAAKISSIKLPDWLTPGSPTPFEMGLRGISAALKQVNAQLPDLAGGLNVSGMAVPQSNQSTVNNDNRIVLTAKYQQERRRLTDTISMLSMARGGAA